MEESANMLLMLAGVAKMLKTTDFLQPYWNVMELWSQYLNSTLPDPGNQLCTDDFVRSPPSAGLSHRRNEPRTLSQEGPSPHNCNLAVKGILGLGAYALLLNASGQAERATVYMNQAQMHGNKKPVCFFSSNSSVTR